VETDLLSTLQTPLAGARKLILVDKDLLTHLANNESKALARIEPLDRAPLLGQSPLCEETGWTQDWYNDADLTPVEQIQIGRGQDKTTATLLARGNLGPA
jgi:hypothetical protein